MTDVHSVTIITNPVVGDRGRQANRESLKLRIVRADLLGSVDDVVILETGTPNQIEYYKRAIRKTLKATGLKEEKL